MLQLYPQNATERLEFDKIQTLLASHCRTEAAVTRVWAMRFFTRTEAVEKALKQTLEYKTAIEGPDHFPNDFTCNIDKELKLLLLSNAALQPAQLDAVRGLALNMRHILKWFKGREALFPQLHALVEHVEYEQEIVRLISAILDESGQIRDDASASLLQIRNDLENTRHQLRRTFDSVLRKLAKQGFLADTSEGFLNGRRTAAVLAEYKRIVKGILHGVSDSRKTVFIEPEETITLNNEVFSLQHAEGKEIQNILLKVTAALSAYHPLLENYYRLSGIFDFIRAKALLAVDMNGNMPFLSPHPGLRLINAAHPLLYLKNKTSGKATVPLNISLDQQNRILMISGPNAGGKTVSMKTAGLLQLMLQSGLLIPADERSVAGIFKQLMVHIGDTQSIENELSTYSAHLRDMSHFLSFANGKTLFFIDELGSGSDPDLGGAFAEAIVEELAVKKAFGIITTHYMNLKAMAGKVAGVCNAAMAFDERNLQPLYQLVPGKPGSSYTFAIAQRSGLPEKIIGRARALAGRSHFKLDEILHRTEQQSVRLESEEKKLKRLIAENEKKKEQYDILTDKERQKQHYATLKLQNVIRQEELDYLKDTERKFKQIIQEWKRSENKQEVIHSAEQLLFRKKQIRQNASAAKKADKKFRLTGKTPEEGNWVRNTINHQVGKLVSIKGKNAVVQIGKLPFTVNLKDWVAVEQKNAE
jgi:DNA mismatch repair protein MutS2